MLWSKKAEIDAKAVVDEVREREVQELKALMEDGNRLLAAGTADQAVEKFREVIRRKPDSVAAREGLAVPLFRLAGAQRLRFEPQGPGAVSLVIVDPASGRPMQALRLGC